MQELIDKTLNFVGHCGREEQDLPRKGREFEDTFNIRDKAHIKHTVSFVDNKCLHARHKDFAAFKLIEEAARRCDKNINTLHKLTILLGKGYAANQERHFELKIFSVKLDVFSDLRCEFARRANNQTSGHTRASTPLRELVHGR